ncbi:periplasmic heavy metal sensor [Echinicola jeungdonensis]|uniref:Spy/CpxP family protein refolding chaperone n=1 Tax=Echinicola jeungdonensis TaxID=709343 RepID=A0ABV5J8P6_9BACT|nr:periplasmic heavy metal sensor [Echinicola jeungdonensis]MDN3669254.1 periplasmic heavy metal sensor [Echinicola jeungdonensis]
MKNLLIVAALMLVIVFQSQAQRGEHKREFNPEKMAQKITDKMAEKLELSEDQKQKVYQLHLDRLQKRKEQHQEMMEKRKAMREKMEAEHKENQAKLEEILTPEQKAKWEEIKKDEWEKRRKYRDAKGNPDREKLKKMHQEKKKEGESDG